MGEWQDISTAPKDGSAFLGYDPGDTWPSAMRWQAYDAEDVAEIGEPGFWTYCEDLIADAAGGASPPH